MAGAAGAAAGAGGGAMAMAYMLVAALLAKGRRRQQTRDCYVTGYFVGALVTEAKNKMTKKKPHYYR